MRDINTLHLQTVSLGAIQFLIRQAIDIYIRATEVAITSPSNATLRGVEESYKHIKHMDGGQKSI